LIDASSECKGWTDEAFKKIDSMRNKSLVGQRGDIKEWKSVVNLAIIPALLAQGLLNLFIVRGVA
jgi:hypothetical protein